MRAHDHDHHDGDQHARGGLWHRLEHVLRPHSHDSTEKGHTSLGDYYDEQGESPGRWMGAGLDGLEITARTGTDPGRHYEALEARYGSPRYTRIDAPATPEQKKKLKALSPAAVTAAELAGEAITAKLTKAPGNGADIGGLKVTTDSGWFAARPSGTEDVYKIYAESFQGDDHLARIQEEARDVVAAALQR